MVQAEVIDRWRKAPRLNGFAAFFEQTARGEANQPDLEQPDADTGLFNNDLDCLTFGDTHRRLWGAFDSHYFASIPFRLEEEWRLGAAILRHNLKIWAQTGRPATLYSLGAGAGTLARTLARLGDGRLATLCCSPTDGNRISFSAQRGSPYAFFHHGPFFELDDARYAVDPNLAAFTDGFDVLFEDTTFQMYGGDRVNQTAFVAPRIRERGLFVQVQKLRHPDPETYWMRERQKDVEFKARFFSQAQIAEKRREVLNTMDNFQVELEASVAALAQFFRYTMVTWNSGNFYTIVSSNSADTLCGFVNGMIQPAIPDAYCYETLPLGFDRGERFTITDSWRWREADAIVPGEAAYAARQQSTSPGATITL